MGVVCCGKAELIGILYFGHFTDSIMHIRFYRPPCCLLRLTFRTYPDLRVIPRSLKAVQHHAQMDKLIRIAIVSHEVYLEKPCASKECVFQKVAGWSRAGPSLFFLTSNMHLWVLAQEDILPLVKWIPQWSRQEDPPVGGIIWVTTDCWPVPEVFLIGSCVPD